MSLSIYTVKSLVPSKALALISVTDAGMLKAVKDVASSKASLSINVNELSDSKTTELKLEHLEKA